MVAGVLLWRGHARRYAVGVAAWGGASVMIVDQLARLWWQMERGRHVLWEWWALASLLLLFSITAVGYLVALGWTSKEATQ